MRARTVRFAQVPEVQEHTWGGPGTSAVHESERQHLPPSPEPGVTYRDVAARTRLGRRMQD